MIPVYNKQDYIEKCVTSLLEDKSQVSLQIVLVDDGSTDESGLICENLSQINPDAVCYIKKDNGGVSSARNVGIDNSLGKYILFLDADDALSPGSMERIISFFEANLDLVDLVTYPLTYYNPDTNSQWQHERQRWLNCSGVYSLEEYPYIAQTTINICIKNQHECAPHFSSSLKMGEDQLFCSELLFKKSKIGYCADAEYIYTRDGGGASSTRNNPLYAYDDMIRLYSRLIELGRMKHEFKSYAQQLVLYNINWRLRGNMLFPTHFEGDERVRQENRLWSIVSSIDSSEIVKSPYLTHYHKGFLLSKAKYSFCDNLSIEYGHEIVSVESSDLTEPWALPTPLLDVTRAFFSNGSLELEGHISCPAFIFEDAPRMEIEIGNDIHQDVPLQLSSYSYSAAKVLTGKMWNFLIRLPFNFCSDAQKEFNINFSLSFGPRKVERCNVSAKNLLRHNSRILSNELLFHDISIRLLPNRFVLKRRNLKSRLGRFARDIKRHRKLLKRRMRVKALMRRNRKRRVWLYSDLPTSRTLGNAFMQFSHDFSISDGVERYYVTSDITYMSMMYPVYADCFIEYKSKKHKDYALIAEVFLASYLDRITVLPFSKKWFNGIGDLIPRQLFVYLQHGVLHAHMPWYFSRDRIIFDKEVISTSFEERNLTSNYLFEDCDLIKSGMPIFDNLELDSSPERKILYIPSWRSNLVHLKGLEREGSDSSMTSSAFYIGASNFIEKIIRSRFLQERDFILEIKLHPNFHCYKHLFEFDNERIKLADDTIEENAYAIVISDYSSYIYDFVYLGRKILYFIPDYNEFKAGLNHYWELDLPFEEGFGPVAKNSQDAFALLQSMVESFDGDSTDWDLRYKERSESFFLHHDHYNCDRVYQALVEEMR